MRRVSGFTLAERRYGGDDLDTWRLLSPDATREWTDPTLIQLVSQRRPATMGERSVTHRVDIEVHQEGLPNMQHLRFASLDIRTRVVVLVVIAAACGGSPTSPSRYPRVTGNYIGDLTISAPSLRVVSSSGSYQMKVAQSGNHVTIGGVSLPFIREGIELPSITGTINETGVFTPTPGATLRNEPSCGRWTLGSATISFTGRSLQIQETMETDRCGVIGLSGTLTRRG